MNETARVTFNELAVHYDHAFTRKIDLAENQVTFGLIPQGGHILDLGCGTGLYLEYCQPGNYVGLDISSNMLGVARAKFPGQSFIEGDMANLGAFGDNVFDAIVSTMGSFSYCLQPHRAIGEMWRVLRPGGTIFIMAYGKRYRHRKSHITGNTVPFIIWDRKTLKRAFKQFQQVKVIGMSGHIASLFPWAMTLEMQTLGRVWPSSCYWQIVTGYA